jgi:putative hemolysin
LRTLFREQQYSRMPVYRDNLDNIIGIVFVKDLVALPPTGRTSDHDVDARRLLRS